MSYIIQSYPIVEAAVANGTVLSKDSEEWLQKWKGMDLEDAQKYSFPEISGSTSINLKIKTKDADPKSRGTFVPRNGAANPNTEIAYFNTAVILGWDSIFRPAARYDLGPTASAAFKKVILASTIKGNDRNENKAKILAAIAKGLPLHGTLKAKKSKSAAALDSIANSSATPNGAPKSSHPVIAALQAGNPLPTKGTKLSLSSQYQGDALDLARQYSVIMTLDAVFGQWDRYSGGNVVISKTKDGVAQFYATDNGGADLGSSSSWPTRNLSWFSRFDREVIAKLRKVSTFLKDPATGFLGYTDANKFVVDLGLYFELQPAVYVTRLARNLDLLLDRVKAVESQHGDKTYLQ